MKRKMNFDNKHLDITQREIIQVGIKNGSTKAAIARTIGKDPTTIAKEIRTHREFKPRNTFNNPILCVNRNTPFCLTNRCMKKCDMFEEPKCNRRDKSPGACNGCKKSPHCRLDKYYYNYERAHQKYKADLANYREGINSTPEDCALIGNIIAPLLKQGQSVHQILSSHKEITQSERTIYTYIETGVFKGFGVDNFSLKEQVNRKQFKNKYKKRKEHPNYKGREYSDYILFTEEHPDVPTTEMDTVYNNQSGPYIQT